MVQIWVYFDILLNSICISFMFTFNNWYYKRCCKPCRRCHRCVIMFTTNDTLKMIDEYPSREMTTSSDKHKRNKKSNKVKDKGYNLFVDDSERANTFIRSQYGSFGAKSSATNPQTYGGSYDLDREPSRSSFSVNKEPGR